MKKQKINRIKLKWFVIGCFAGIIASNYVATSLTKPEPNIDPDTKRANIYFPVLIQTKGFLDPCEPVQRKDLLWIQAPCITRFAGYFPQIKGWFQDKDGTEWLAIPKKSVTDDRWRLHNQQKMPIPQHTQ